MDKRKWRSIILFVVIATAVYFVNVEVQTYLGKKALAESGLAIHTLDEALSLAREQGDKGSLVLADLSAIWCPTCRKLDKTVLSDEGVQKVIREGYLFARIEFESAEGEAFKARYGLTGFPNLLVLNGRGELIRKLDLEFDPEAFKEQLLTVRNARLETSSTSEN